MSFAAMLASHDEAALAALASKGVLRRAAREAPSATVIERGAEAATVETDGQRVEIDGKGPASARCTCPASGVCRHILVAVLALRSEEPAEAAVSAAEEIAALPEAEVQKFAGADWGAACRIAGRGDARADGGQTCTVALGADIEVSFIAGQGLAGAAYKGPPSRRRVHVAAAAISLRALAGVTVSAPDAPADRIDPEVCAEVVRRLETAVPSALAGSAEIAADALFDLAVSARAAAAPRLASQLRSLSNGASLAAKRDVAFDPAGFLEAAARCYGLALALADAPGDPLLSGVSARSYVDAAALDLRLMGTSKWRTPSGARGLTVHLFDPVHDRWYRQVTARAAGADLAFDVHAAYRAGIWGAGSPDSLKGALLHLPKPRVAPDGQIAPSGVVAQRRPDPLTEDSLAEIATRDWADWRSEMAGRLGRGLRRSALAHPALLMPQRFGDLAFDDIAQHYRLPLLDRAGAALSLEIAAEPEMLAPELFARRSEIAALLVEVQAGSEGWSIRPVTALVRGRTRIQPVDLGFSSLGPPAGFKGRLTGLRDLLRRPPTGTRAADALLGLVDDLTAGLVDALAAPAALGPVAARLEEAGLPLLAAQTRAAAARRTTRAILAAAYLASELRQELA